MKKKKQKKLQFVPIYLLRTHCVPCDIDTARTFVLKDGENPTMAFEQMEAYARKMWPLKYPRCTHRYLIQWITDKEYKWDLRKKEAVLR